MLGIVASFTPHPSKPTTHGVVTLSIDGVQHTFTVLQADLDQYQFDAARFRRDLIYVLNKVSNVPLSQFAGRVCIGEEATNVKQYIIIGKDVTKTNIGTAYVNVPVGASGERSLVEFTGCTQFRVVIHANLVGTGPFGFRLIRDGDSAVLYENASVALTGERELDTDWQPLPAAASGLTLVRLQAKSIVAADDPVVRRCLMLVK